ncbi:hypothetical protein LH464_08870 [Neorhizobium sp. T786]|nr:hypothetical protein [Neorhizobium xiangyangii]MCB5202591.1 hypothetical protein [Neorhizobium xiangyangii]
MSDDDKELEAGRDDAPAGRQHEMKLREEQRRTRAAAKLRENLMRRKGQARARRSGAADETDGLPAAKKDESP